MQRIGWKKRADQARGMGIISLVVPRLAANYSTRVPFQGSTSFSALFTGKPRRRIHHDSLPLKASERYSPV